MNSLRRACLIALLILLAAPIALSQSNLVPNPSFEIGSGDSPSGWYYWGDQTLSSQHVWSNSISHTGARSVGISDVVMYSGGWGWAGFESSDFMPIVPGEQYETSVWILLTQRSSIDRSMFIETEFYDDSGNYLNAYGGPLFGLPLNQWWKYNVTWTAPDNAVKMKIALDVSSEASPPRNSVYFDDVAVVKASRDVSIRYSYAIGSNQVTIGTVPIQLDGTTVIGNLSFAPTSTLLWMPSINNASSNTFVLKAILKNDGIALMQLQSPTFVLSGSHDITGSVKIEILASDNNASDNTIQQDFEVWFADFKYGKDNYSFPNWAASLSEVGGIMDAYLREQGLTYLMISPHLLDAWYGWVSTGGHCYGMATTSIYYKDHAASLPNLKSSTYQLQKTNKVKDNIKIAFSQQWLVNLMAGANWENPFATLKKVSANMLSFVTFALSNNSLVCSSFNNHSTVTHTMILQGGNYYLFDYDNNPNQYMTPIYRSAFYRQSDGQYEHSSGDTRMWFEHPGITLPSNAIAGVPGPIADSLIEEMQRQCIDSLKRADQNMLVVIDRSFGHGDSASVAEITLDNDIQPAYDFGRFRVFLFSNTLHPNLSMKATSGAALFVMGVSTCDSLPKQVLFENIPYSTDSSIAHIADLFGTKETQCRLDFDGNGKHTTLMQASYEGGPFLSMSNLPPRLTKPLPVILLSDAQPDVTLDLRDYVLDASSSSLKYAIDYDTTSVSATIIQDILTVHKIASQVPNSALSIVASNNSFAATFVLAISSTVVSTVAQERETPRVFRVYPNFPNPFNPSSTVRYELPQPCHTRVDLFDQLGRLVRELVNEGQTEGYHELKIDAKNLATGMYFLRVEAGNHIEAIKLLLLR